jgi:hypothetical protein
LTGVKREAGIVSTVVRALSALLPPARLKSGCWVMAITVGRSLVALISMVSAPSGASS